MKKKLKDFLVFFRKFFFIFICIFSYIFFLYSFYINEYWFMSTVYLIIFFIFFHYVFIELRNVGYIKFILVFVISLFIEILIFVLPFSETYDFGNYLLGFGLNDIFKMLSLIVLNVAIIFLIIYINDDVNNRRILSSWSIFNSGIGLFSFIITLSYSLMFVVKYDEFRLNCSMIYKGSAYMIDFFASPLGLSISQVENIKSNISNINNTKIKDILGLPEGFDVSGIFTGDIDLKNIKKSDLEKEFIEGLKKTYSGKIPDDILKTFSKDLQDDIMRYEKTKGKDKEVTKGILGKIDSFKDRIIDQVLADKKLIDSGVCSYIVDEIGKRYNKPQFKFSVIVLLWFLIFPFVRIFFFVLGIINLIVFKLLNLLGVYKFIKIKEDVEEIL